MIARHCKLGVLLLNYKVGEFLRLLMRELIAEAQTVVIEAETNIYKETTLISTQLNEQLVVVVANLAALAPYRLPSLVESGILATEQRETLTHRIYGTLRLSVVETIGLICVIHKLETESAWLYNRLILISKGICRYTTLLQREGHLQIAIRRSQCLCKSRKGTKYPYDHQK